MEIGRFASQLALGSSLAAAALLAMMPLAAQAPNAAQTPGAGGPGARGGRGGANREPIKEEPTIWLRPGVPDLQGIWSNNWIVDMAAGRYAEKTVEVPFTVWGKKLWDERTGNLQKNDPNLACKPSGLPRAAGTPYPMQIVQTDKQVIFLYEGGLHTFRIVPVNGQPHHKDPYTWMGDSVGHYEGDTLVIDVIGFNDQESWLDSAGHPHSDQLHLIERFRRPNATTMHYEVTIEDPKAYTKPWTTAYIYRQRPDMEIMEYWCTENERDAKHMVGK